MVIKYNKILLIFSVAVTFIMGSVVGSTLDIFTGDCRILKIPVISKDNGIRVIGVREVFEHLPPTLKITKPQRL